MPHILIVEDDIAFGTMLQTWLRKKGFEVDNAANLVLSDLRLPDHDGLRLLKWMRDHDNNAPFIVMTNYAEVQNAVLAMKSGAADYIAKPVQPDILLQKIKDALSAANAQPVQTVATPTAPDKPVRNKPVKSQKREDSPRYIEGKSEASRQLYSYVELVAPTPMSVLILGASGTGKEYVARRIHELSQRHDRPFFALDCGAIPRDVAASEFFGHKKGAFTGADTDKCGAFEMANGASTSLLYTCQSCQNVAPTFFSLPTYLCVMPTRNSTARWKDSIRLLPRCLPRTPGQAICASLTMW